MSGKGLGEKSVMPRDGRAGGDGSGGAGGMERLQSGYPGDFGNRGCGGGQGGAGVGFAEACLLPTSPACPCLWGFHPGITWEYRDREGVD